MQKVKNIKFLLPLFIWCITLAGCIKEDRSNCQNPEPPIPKPSGVVLKYTYDLNMEYKNLFGEAVGGLNAYIFNEQGVLLDSLVPSPLAGELTNAWERSVDLEPGKYTIVTWAGSEGFYKSYTLAKSNETATTDFQRGVTIGTTKLEDFRIFLNYSSSDVPEDDPEVVFPDIVAFDDLFHGIASNVEVKSGEVATITTPLVKDSKTILVKLTGLSNIDKLGVDATTVDDFSFSLKGRNGHYRYDNSINEYARMVSYQPQGTAITGDELTTKFKTLRLMRGVAGSAFDPSLEFAVYYKDDEKPLFEPINVVETILSSKIDDRDANGNIKTDSTGKPIKVPATFEYLDRQDVFELEFEAFINTDKKLDFTIKVNGWKISNIYPADL